MKKKKNRMMLAYLATILLFNILPAWNVNAAGFIDTTRNVTLEINYVENDIQLSNVLFQIYKVADVSQDAKLSKTDTFKEYSIFLESMETSDYIALANTLYGYISRDNILPDDYGYTNVLGKVTFPCKAKSMLPGLYLVIGQESCVGQTTYIPQPFLIMLPNNMNEDVWDYHMSIHPKVEKEQDDPSSSEEDTVNIKGIKLWNDIGEEEFRPSSIELELLCDGAIYETVLLSEDNNWRYAWSGLPDGHTWQIIEKDVPNHYTVLCYQEDNTYFIENTYQIHIEDEEIPTGPIDDEKDNDKEKNDEEINIDEEDIPLGPSDDKLPQTGMPWEYIILSGFVCLVTMVLMAIMLETHVKFSKKEKRLFGAILFVFCFSLIGTLLYVYALNYRGKSQNQEILKQMQFAMNRTTDVSYAGDFLYHDTMTMPYIEIDGETYIGILEIPDLGLSFPINRICSKENLKNSPCRYVGSVYQDNMVIAAHNYHAHFGKIKDLYYGSTIYFEDLDKNIMEYEVSDIQILKADDVEEMINGDWDMTLFTCTIGGRERVTIRCKKVS